MLQAAGELISEGGTSAATLAAIGDRSGYSRGLVTARFGSKEGMIRQLIDRLVYRWRERVVAPTMEGRDGLAEALGLVVGIWQQIERDPTDVRVLYTLLFEAAGPASTFREIIAERHTEQREAIAGALRRGIVDGSVEPGVDADTEAALLVAGLRGVGYQWLLDDAGIDPVTALQLLLVTTAKRVGMPPSVAQWMAEFERHLASAGSRPI
jgi:AcrR family transcriptional regulator